MRSLRSCSLLFLRMNSELREGREQGINLYAFTNAFVRISMSSISIGMMSLIENTRGTVSRCVSSEDERFGK